MDSGSNASDMRASLTAALPRPALGDASLPRRSLSSRLLARKPLGVILAEEEEGGGEGGHGLEKELGLTDLLAIGIGGTVGSGVFVLTGQIAREYSGPAVLVSWAIAGVGCVLSGLSYAEMSARIPSAGSCYAYSYFALGELPAYVASWLLTLEYAVSGCAVARSWAPGATRWSSGWAAWAAASTRGSRTRAARCWRARSRRRRWRCCCAGCRWASAS